jgi:plasmid stability protein
MNLTIENLPARVWQGLKRKAKASGRSVEAEAASILAEAVVKETQQDDPAERFLAMVDEMYGSNRPKNVVDEFLAERRELWGEKY